MEFLERGDIYVFARTAAEDAQAQGAEAGGRFLILLSPRARAIHRRVVMRGDKPRDTSSHGPCWGYVDEVRSRTDEIVREHQAAATHPVSAGLYAIFVHDQHSHFVYALETPAAAARRNGAGEPVAHEPVIPENGSYLVAIRSPEDRHLIAVSSDVLDEEGAEIALNAADDSASANLGVNVDPLAERRAAASAFKELRRGLVPRRIRSV